MKTVDTKDTFQDVLNNLKPDLVELSLRAESYQIEITKILEELARNIYKTFNYKKESGGVGLVIGRGQVAFGFKYKDYKDLTPSDSKEALEELKRIIVEDFQPWVKSQLGN